MGARGRWGRRRAGGVALAGLGLLGLLGGSAPPRATAAAPVATGAPEDPLVYVALGDSFTSGPLVLPHDTTHVPQDCGQSSRNYPHLVALLLGAVLRDMSCGSAEIEDLFEPQRGLPLGGTNRPQADVLGPEVDVVTVGVGGNDVGFVGVATDCLRLGREPPLGRPPCHPGFVVDGVDTVGAAIAATELELADALVQVQRRAPNADVFVVSYPASLPDDGVACWPYLPILPEDMPHLVRWFKAMNGALAAAAEATGATYVDIYTPSIGHDACQPPGVAWVNGLVVVPPSYPAHPNDLSFLASAPVVAAAIRAELAEADRPADPAPPAPEPSEPPPLGDRAGEGGERGPTGPADGSSTTDGGGAGRTRLPATGAGPPVGVGAAILAAAVLARSLGGRAGRGAATRSPSTRT